MHLHDPSYTGEIHPIPSALGSEALAGPASTTVRENVGSPDEDCFALFFARIYAPHVDVHHLNGARTAFHLFWIIL